MLFHTVGIACLPGRAQQEDTFEPPNIVFYFFGNSQCCTAVRNDMHLKKKAQTAKAEDELIKFQEKLLFSLSP